MRRVVVTGMGIVTPLGVGYNSVWKKLINSETGISKVTAFDVSDLPSKVAGQVPLGSYSDGMFTGEEWVDAKDLRRQDLFITYAMAAAKQAVEDSSINNLSEEVKENIGVCIGAGIGGLTQIYLASASLAAGEYRKISPFFIPSSLINLASGNVSMKYGFKGPNLSVVTACASGTNAIGDSMRLIQNDEVDIMVCGGAEASVSRIGIAGFGRMNALSTNFNDNPEKASRPWDKERDGFVIAEGSGILILEELEHAKKRGAKIYGEVVGYGMSGDANHVTAPDPAGTGARLCMERALKYAKINSDVIGYINAHGTSTPLGDLAEVSAVKRIFNNSLKEISVSSTKSATGHLLGAAGAIEAIFSLLALRDGILPPTLNLENPDEGCDLNFIPLKAQEKKIEYAMSNSFGFGGTNSSLIFKKFN